ncbi:transcription termination factor MTERF9, chloroplastic-like [Triticum dicoccoides]|uniref:transcription termination factor MTERF9, chloroplastic-like n=1 Tax=Triticum dicoccoides TaxID=85692 RepID=UPI00188FDD48|nr:transcription termination factor MTERF9, chloroplastic-like [Triticum dicoccoides]
MLQLQMHPLLLPRAGPHPTTATLSYSLHRRLALSASTTPFSTEEYLIVTCGLTRAQALKASKKLCHLKSASNPDAVLALLSGVGLSRPDIAAVVAADPLLLRSRVDNVAPRLSALRDRLGLSAPEIASFLLVGATALRSCDITPKLEFWIPFFGSFGKLLQTMKRNRSILTTDLEKVAKPNIALLEQCGLSVCDIVKLSTPCSRLLVFNPERVKAFVLRAEKLGVPRSSYIFKYAVGVACSITEDKVAARMEFLRSTLGCSMDKVRVAVRNKPHILGISEEKLRLKIEFMVNEVGLDPEYIVERPMLFTYSLEKRMKPRYYVAKILQVKGLMKKSVGFRRLVGYGEDNFIATYMDSHQDTVPGLADAYAAARAGEMLLMSSFESRH